MPTRCWEFDGAARFDGRAQLYAAARPSYPDAAIDFIVSRAGAGAKSIADLGAGTGISTRLLARLFPSVLAVEPNIEMTLAADESRPSYVLGKTERLPFRSGSLDLVTAFNSFHWFVPEEAMPELDRVIRPGGALAIVWNDWDLDDEFTASFFKLMRSAAGDYPPEDRDAEVAPLYRCGRFGSIEHRGFENRHRLDRDGLTKRLQSMSFVPTTGPEAARLVSELGALHDRFADASGYVEHRYVTAVYFAKR